MASLPMTSKRSPIFVFFIEFDLVFVSSNDLLCDYHLS